jgi:nucleoside diphosphate kinase
MNIFSLHHKKPFIEDILDYMLSGECIVLLLCHETENPIDKWKKLIGPMDPVEAKVIMAKCIFSEIRPIKFPILIWDLNHTQ